MNKDRVNEDRIDKWLRKFQREHEELVHIGVDELRDLAYALFNDIPLGYEASMRLANWLLDVEMGDGEGEIVDADGVPIHVGDELECHSNGYDGTFTVFAIGDNVVVGNHDIEWIRRNPSKWFHIASLCTHVKPCTLESILCDALTGVSRMNYGIARTFKPDEPYVAELAAEIRKHLGVSE